MEGRAEMEHVCGFQQASGEGAGGRRRGSARSRREQQRWTPHGRQDGRAGGRLRQRTPLC